MKIDLGKNEVVQTIRFDESVAPQGTYLNDVRFSPDGSHAFITDSGARGALIVVDLKSGNGRRVLDGDPTTQVEPDVVVRTDGQELRRPDGRPPKFAADGIALAPDGEHLYWQALTGRTLYRIATRDLIDDKLSPADLKGRVETVGKNGVSDGLWMDGKGRMFISALEENAIKVRHPDGTVATLIQDDRLRWPDTFAQGADGTIYVTTSQIQDMAQYHEKGSTRTAPYGLWKFMPPDPAPRN